MTCDAAGQCGPRSRLAPSRPRSSARERPSLKSRFRTGGRERRGAWSRRKGDSNECHDLLPPADHSHAWLPAMTLIVTLASRNLFHDRVRLIATVVGIVFSIVLVTVQLGVFVSFERMITTMIDHAQADF